MRINLNFYVEINENSNIYDLRKLINDTFKQDFDIIFRGKRIKQDQELNKINVSQDSKLFLMFKQLKANNAKHRVFHSKAAGKSVKWAEKADSTNHIEFSKEENEEESKAKAENKNQKEYLQKPASKIHIESHQEHHNIKTDIKEDQLKNKVILDEDLQIEQNAMQWFQHIRDIRGWSSLIIQIGKDPLFYDEFLKIYLLLHPGLFDFFTLSRSDIIKLCEEKWAQIYSKPEIEQDFSDTQTKIEVENIEQLYNLGDREKVLNLCNEGIKDDPKNWFYRTWKVRILTDLDRKDEIFDDYNEAIYKDECSSYDS